MLVSRGNYYSLVFMLFMFHSQLRFGIASLQIVASDGSRVSSSVLKDHLYGKAPCLGSVSNILKCSDEAGLNGLVNDLFDAEFNENKGVQFHLGEKGVTTLSSFEEMFDRKLCGANLVDYCSSLPGATCILISANDVDIVLKNNEQIFRRLVNSIHNRSNEKKSQQVTFILHSTGDSLLTNTSIDKVKTHFKNIWRKEYPMNNFEKAVDLKVIQANRKDISSAKDELFSHVMSEGPDNDFDVVRLSEELLEQWDKLPETPTETLSLERRESIFQIEREFTSNLRQANVALNMWQSRVSGGRLIGRFGVQVDALLSRSSDDFNRRTVGFSTARERAERSKTLQEHIASVATRLCMQQIGIAAADASDEFKKTLFMLACSSEGEDLVGGSEAIKRSLSTFHDKIEALISDKLRVATDVSAKQQEVDLRTTLEGLLVQFPQSTAAKLAQLRRTARIVKNDAQAKKKRSRALGVSLSLVGMLRLPGRGGFQAIVNYAANVLNTPVDLLLGIQNDGESLEVMGEDREYPLLRIQPKFNVAVDL